MNVVERQSRSENGADNVAEREIFRRWLEILEGIRVSEHREPIINKEQFLQMLEMARVTQQPIVFVAIGCQDWVKPEWSETDTDRIMGKVTAENKRAKRFVAELAGFSQALSSFNVPHRIHFSLSDIEALMHIHLQNLGLVIHNDDAEEVLKRNVRFLAQKLQENGAQVEPFNHSQILQKILGTEDLAEMQSKISGSGEVNYRQFLDNLYVLDIETTAQQFIGENEVGPAWLDIQSFNFIDDVIALQNTAAQVAPEMPILSLFPNAGNWHAGQQATVTFPSKQDVVARMIGSQSTPQTQEEWLNKVHRTKDRDLISVLENLGQDGVAISSGPEKMAAVRMFFSIVFGFDPLQNRTQE